MPSPLAARGSSPLARGLLARDLRRMGLDRIIPARAGFTAARVRRRRRGADHPRSRGVYRSSSGMTPPWSGSSPLARGLRLPGRILRFTPGIIPARAGFTRAPPRTRPPARDHPRSRGVYWPERPAWTLSSGSSPLARGLPDAELGRLGGPRIIPARAGFTATPRMCPMTSADHPRSRGVYPARPAGCRSRQWIIPARAGFTPETTSTSSCRRGSSPLARGLRPPGRTGVPGRRIIPARAGFTDPRPRPPPRPRDHPRSRGVLRGPVRCVRAGPGIIPARAGFTPRGRSPRSQHGDHPRSRGVYSSPSRGSSTRPGSSPLARGLHVVLV